MAAEINFSRLLRQLPELRSTLVENRRIILIPAGAVVGYFVLRDPVKDALDRLFAYVYYKFVLKSESSPIRANLVGGLRSTPW